MSNIGNTTMKSLAIARKGVKTRRESSWDRTGGNIDYRPIPAGESLELGNLKGPGCITHLWFTMACIDRHYLRTLVLRIWWDGEKTPSVEVPVGDFFGAGHARMQAYQCFPFYCSNGNSGEGDNSAMNCYFQMPFAKSARIEVSNEGTAHVDNFYYYVDYETYSTPLPKDALRFHAQWRRENPTKGIKGVLGEQGRNYWGYMHEPNLSGEENYVILEAKGRGQYVGCNLSVDNFERLPNAQMTWWGEGDDMIFIDGEKMPSMVGTGSEDYFCHAWGMQKSSGLYAGTSVWHMLPESGGAGKFTCYRYHIEDPVVFEKSVKVTMEHGHANLQNHDFASTAFWYQAEPHAAFPKLPGVADRMPRPDPVVGYDNFWADPANRIREWAVLGPFERKEGHEYPDDGVRTVYPVEKFITASNDKAFLNHTYQTKAGEQTWKKVPAGLLGCGIVNLCGCFPRLDRWSVAFLMTKIYAKKARTVTLYLNHDDGCKAWLNGKKIFENSEPRDMNMAPPHAIPIRLKAGDNALVLKIDQLLGCWGAWAAIEDKKTVAPKPKKVAKPKVVRKDLECWMEV